MQEQKEKQRADGVYFIVVDDEYKRPCNKSWARLIKKNIRSGFLPTVTG